MKFSMVAAFLGLSTFTSALVVRQNNDTQILSDIQAIVDGVTKIQGSIEAFPAAGGPFSVVPALGILGDSSNLNNAINNAANTANNSPKFSDSQSEAVANAILDLQPSIKTVLDALVSKREGFKTALLGGDASLIVVGTLNMLRGSTDNFAKAVIAKLNADFAAIAPDVAKEIDGYFASALAAFQ